MRHEPCKNCPDKYTACSDYCQKPEYLAYREELAIIRKNERNYICPVWTHGDRDSRRRG